MELDEMKNTWYIMDKRLNKMELIHDTFIREVIQSKVNKSIDKLKNWEITGTAVVILLIPIIIYLYLTTQWDFITWDLFVIFSGLICTLLTFWQIVKVRQLMKVDYTENIARNIHHINLYKIQYEKEKLVMSVIGPVLTILIVMNYLQMKAELHRWAFMIAVILFAGIYCYWSYKNMIKQKIPAILKSMEELKELQEE